MGNPVIRGHSQSFWQARGKPATAQITDNPKRLYYDHVTKCFVSKCVIQVAYLFRDNIQSILAHDHNTGCIATCPVLGLTTKESRATLACLYRTAGRFLHATIYTDNRLFFN